MALRKPKITTIDVIDSIGGVQIDNKNYPIIAKSAFWVRGSYYIGVQYDCWEEDELAWDNDNKGAWSNLGSVLRDGPRDLRLEGATYESDGVDDIARIAPNSTQKLSYEIDSRTMSPVGGVMYYPGEAERIGQEFIFDYSIVNSDTGEIPIEGEFKKIVKGNPTLSTPEFTLPSGNYIARVKLRAIPFYELPPNYIPPDEYKYEEDGEEWVYDPERNIGRIPRDRNHELLKERTRIVNANEQKDDPSEIIYLISPEQQSGEWAQLKIAVGSQQWTWNDDVMVTLGPVLIKKIKQPNGTFVKEYVHFDPLARSISANCYLTKNVILPNGNVKVPKGSYLFAGNRSTRSGAVLALWALLPNNTIVLLGTNLNPSTGACECHLVDHSASDIKQNLNGKVYVLTKCSLHEYLPQALKVEQALPGIPEESDGHPGGQALNLIGDKIYFFSEYFGQFGEIKISFYNFLVDQRGSTRHSGDGTVFHGPNCATTWLNKLWGIYQDKPFSDKTAVQYLAHYDGLTWAKKEDPDNRGTYIVNADLKFKASEYRWQRVIQVNNVMHLFGKKPDIITENGSTTQKQEDGIMGISDENGFTMMDFNYRVLRGDISPTPDPELDRLLVIAKGVNNNVLDGTTYYVIEVDYLGKEEIFEYEDGCFVLSPPLTTQEEVDEYFETHAKYLWWEDSEWMPHDYPPQDDAVCFLTLTVEEGQNGGFIMKYCDTCLLSGPCLNSCENFFCWDKETGCFTISKATLLAKYGISEPLLLPEFAEFDGNNCFIRTETPNDVYLERSISSTSVSYCVPSSVELPFNPASAFGPGNALDISDYDKLCLVHTCPPYDYEECNLLKIVYEKVTRGRWAKDELGEFILDGEGNKIFVPCDPNDAGEALDTMPEGTKWKTIPFPRHGLPLNIIDLVDLMEDYRLKDMDQLYFTAWYRNTFDPPYVPFDPSTVVINPESNLSAAQQIEKANREWDKVFLSKFSKRIKYHKLNKFKKPHEEGVEVVVLVAPKASPTLLPVVLRII